MAEKTYLQAISDGLRQEMRRDNRVFVIGEDVGVYSGAFKVTLVAEFGPWRMIDSPLAETAILGAATGASMMGMRHVAEMQFADFISCGWDTSSPSPRNALPLAGTPVPIVVRLPSGGGFSEAAVHSQNPESSFAHPGARSSAERRRRTRRAYSSPRSRIPTRPLLRAQAPLPADQGEYRTTT